MKIKFFQDCILHIVDKDYQDKDREFKAEQIVEVDNVFPYKSDEDKICSDIDFINEIAYGVPQELFEVIEFPENDSWLQWFLS